MFNALCSDIRRGISVGTIMKRYEDEERWATYMRWEPETMTVALFHRTNRIDALMLGMWVYSVCPLEGVLRAVIRLIEYGKHSWFPALEMIDLLLGRAVAAGMGGHLACILEKSTMRNYYNPAICKRLLDAGAQTSMLKRCQTHEHEAIVAEWWRARRSGRLACVTLLSLRGKLSLFLSRCLPHDILLAVAQHRWRSRFHVPAMRVRTRPKRKGK